jgi:tetratricopeptide (TPR) repeat protein
MRYIQTALVIFVLTLLISGCSRARPKAEWTDRMLANREAADRLENPEQTRRKYLDHLDKAPNDRAHRELYLRLGELAERRQKYGEAREWYRKSFEDNPGDQLAAEAKYQYIHLSDNSTVTPQPQQYRRIIRQYPDAIYAEYAVERLREQLIDRGVYGQLLSNFSSLYFLTRDREVGDFILYEWAQVYVDVLARPAEALRVFRRLVKNHPGSGQANNGLWQIAQLYEQHQYWRPALRTFGMLANRVEESWFIGSYNSPFANDARLRRAKIYMLFLDKYDEAIEELQQYREDFESSLYLDDVNWHIAEAHRLAGREDSYRQKLRQFLKKFPQSRYTRIIEKRFPEMAESDD